MKAWAYWAGVSALILFGWLAIFSIGAPFFLLGVMLAALFPWRERRGVLATGMAVVFGLVVGYVLVAPLSCTTTSIAVAGDALSESRTTCRNLLGIRYEGTGSYNPSLLPALVAGITLAVVAGLTTVWAYRRHPAHPTADAVP
jgi:hypothetical protein